MKDKIKEILKKLKSVANRETASRNALMEMKDKDYQLLLDYITNLQQEIKEANESVEWWTNRFKAMQKEIKDKELKKYFKKICISIEEQLKIRDKDFAMILESKGEDEC